VLPLHHPIRVAEQWATLDLLSNGRVDWAAGRGYDRREYEPFKVDSRQSGDLRGGDELVRRLWKLAMSGFRIREILSIRRRADHAAARPETDPSYVASFSKPSIELARAWAAVSSWHLRRRDDLGGLKQVSELTRKAASRPERSRRG